MIEISELIDKNAVDRVAAESGVAIAVVDTDSREVFVSNNNSICRNLNPTGEFSPKCAEYCGQAFEKAREAGRMIGFECHAGLDCRAVLAERSGMQFVTIIGRTFAKAENYRRATERAITGDWRHFPPSKFFENILLTASAEVLTRTAEKIGRLVVGAGKTPDAKPELAGVPGLEAKTESSAKPQAASGGMPAKKQAEEITNLVEKFNRQMSLRPETTERPVSEADASVSHVDEPKTARPPVDAPQDQMPQNAETQNAEDSADQSDRRPADARAWRSFFGSILKNDYDKACNSLLEFLAHQYDLSSLIWLENKDNLLENTAVFGELKNKKVRLSLPADDERLVAAMESEMPLELGERGKSEKAELGRTMNLYPIGVDNNISAALAILNPGDDTVAKKQIARICRSIAPQLEILRLRSQVAKRERVANAIRRLSDSLRGIDADDFWMHLIQNAAEILRAERASLLILDEKSGDLEIKAIIGAKHEVPESSEIGKRVARVVLAKKGPVVISDVGKTGLPPAESNREYKTASFLSCPIMVGNRTIGVMNFTDRVGGEAFDRDSVELIQAIAPQLAVAIDRASLKEKAGEFEQLSVTDALTGLLNRRYIEERLLEEVKRSNRHGFPMSFMMLDVDQFKAYNDQFGHPAGDDALKIVAHVLRDTLRGADVAARFGGEEFAILLPQTSDDEAAAIGERIRLNIEHAAFPHRKVTMSIGIASCSAELCVSSELISAADKALYEAKRQGRNRVLVYEQLSDAAAKV